MLSVIEECQQNRSFSLCFKRQDRVTPGLPHTEALYDLLQTEKETMFFL